MVGEPPYTRYTMDRSKPAEKLRPLPFRMTTFTVSSLLIASMAWRISSVISPGPMLMALLFSGRLRTR